METLRNHSLIYDRDCPLCRAYTSAFVKRGWLDEGGRIPYSEVSAGSYCRLDMQRAKDEIALLNRETGEVVYGLRSLTRIIGHRWQVFGHLLNFPPLRWILQHCYYFISFNRKVIAAVRPSCRPCNPSFHWGYRIAWLLTTFLAVSAILTAYTTAMAPLLPATSLPREYFVCGGQILFQGVVLVFNRRVALMDYLGNMMTVSLMGALALLPVMVLRPWLPAIPELFAAYFLLVAGGMLLEHLRRMKLLGFGLIPTLSWILYRLLVFAAIMLA